MKLKIKEQKGIDWPKFFFSLAGRKDKKGKTNFFFYMCISAKWRIIKSKNIPLKVSAHMWNQIFDRHNRWNLGHFSLHPLSVKWIKSIISASAQKRIERFILHKFKFITPETPCRKCVHHPVQHT